jgi:hypothetical protein
MGANEQISTLNEKSLASTKAVAAEISVEREAVRDVFSSGDYLLQMKKNLSQLEDLSLRLRFMMNEVQSITKKPTIF